MTTTWWHIYPDAGPAMYKTKTKLWRQCERPIAPPRLKSSCRKTTSCLRCRYDPFIPSTLNILKRSQEVLSRAIQPRHVLGRVEIRMYQLNQAVQVLRRYCVVLLIKIVHVAVQDLHEELDGDGGIHAGVGNAQSTLKALENALAVAIGLFIFQSAQ